MNRDEFDIWFRENLDVMVKHGVMHPNSEMGKLVYLVVSAMAPEITALKARIAELEKKQ